VLGLRAEQEYPVPRARMLETVREFVAERLAARPDAAEVGRRHAGYYGALAEQADRPLRSPSQSEWLERLRVDAGNLAAAVRWSVAHDAGPLPHLFRVLWLFWTQLGILAVLQGRLDEARTLLDGALDLSLAARSTPFVTPCLAGYAQLAFANGDLDRAALLEGAADGLRRRVGQPAWPHLRRVEADLVARVNRTLGEDRFDQAFSAGSKLTQRDAVAIVQDQRGTGTHRP
jgi:hypothetical protein